MAGCIVLYKEFFMFPSFTVFGREIGTYGIMIVLGAFACGFVGNKLIKRFGRDIYDFMLIMLAMGGGIFLGAHIVFTLTNIPTLVLAFQNIDKLWFDGFWTLLVHSVGGMVFYGGFLGGIGAIFIYCIFDKRIKPSNLLDIYAVITPLFHTFGRIGCFLGGCCYGVESEFGITIHGNTINPSVNDVNRFPIQLVEAGCNFLIFLLILYLFKKKIMSDKLIYIYMLIYPVVRFIDEFFRGDTYRGIWLGLSTSQWISIILFVFAVVMLIVKRNDKPKQVSANTDEQHI